MSYTVNEIFFSLQGEGARAGTPNVFVRFSFCNLKCSVDNEAGFDCDTDFSSGVKYELDDLVAKMEQIGGECRNVIFTGGEPALQLDQALCDRLHDDGWFIAIETNGTKPLKGQVDWISCSPKSAEHTLRVGPVDELRYVRFNGQGIPKPSLEAAYYCISPAFQADWSVSKEDLQYCIDLVKQNPMWRLSVQQHKLWGVR